MKYIFTILTIIFLSGDNLYAQFDRKVDSLSTAANLSPDEAERVHALGKLAEFFFIYRLDKFGDSVLKLQVKAAELSGKRDLLLIALFGNAINNLTDLRSIESFDRALLFLEKGKNHAKAISSEEYLTLAHVRLAALYRKRGQLENAFSHANIAFTTAQNISKDSIKIVSAIELGDVYQAKGESVLAFKAYTNAFDKSVETGNSELQSVTYHHYAALYQSLKNNEQVKENLLQSLELNTRKNNREGLICDYIDLGRMTTERYYIDKAIALATEYKDEKYIIQAKGILFGYYTYVVGNSDSTLEYINRNEDLRRVYINGGVPQYYWKLGEVFSYSNKLDSATHYMMLALPGIERDFDAQTRQALYEDLGTCFFQLKNHDRAISFYSKAYGLLDESNDPVKAARYSEALSNIYEQEGDFKNAVLFARKKDTLNGILQDLSSQRDITLIELNNEKKKHEKEVAAAQEQVLIKRNLQYMAITIAITVLFLIMIVIGMFPISKLTIKLLGYFAFISLFEFIVLLIDSWLHHIAHGEPLKIWLMKIVLIALLVPFQHYLEHGMIRFLESRRLHKVREKLSVKKWRKKKDLAQTIDDIESDAAVL